MMPRLMVRQSVMHPLTPGPSPRSRGENETTLACVRALAKSARGLRPTR